MQLSLFESPRPDVSGIEFRFCARMRRSWRLEWRRTAVLCVPGYLRAPEFASVLRLLERWAELAMRRQRTAIRAERLILEKQIWNEIERVAATRGPLTEARRRHLPVLRVQGRVHNLQEHLEWVNQRYFGGTLSCLITWSSRIGGTSYHTRYMDHQGNHRDLISISRGYDFENCPDYAIRGVIYHECLHIVVAPVMSGSQRIVHGAEFRRREKLYEHYEQWKIWHESVLPANVRRLRREERKKRVIC